MFFSILWNFVCFVGFILVILNDLDFEDLFIGIMFWNLMVLQYFDFDGTSIIYVMVM